MRPGGQTKGVVYKTSLILPDSLKDNERPDNKPKASTNLNQQVHLIVSSAHRSGRPLCRCG